MFGDARYCLNPANPVHMFVLERLKENKHVVHVEGKVRNLNPFRYTALGDSPILLIIEKFNPSSSLVQAIQRISTRNQTIVVLPKTKKERDFLMAIPFLNNKTWTVLPEYKEWKDKEELCLSLVMEEEIPFKSSRIMMDCVRLLVRNFENVTQYLTELTRISATEEIQESHLEQVFHDVEIVSLHKWAIRFLMGERPRSSLKELNYFLHTKQYHPNWILDYLKKETVQIGMIYAARQRGVLLNENICGNIRKRAEVSKFPYGKELSKVRTQEMQNYLKFIGVVPFARYRKIQSLILPISEGTETSLYSLFSQLQLMVSQEGA